MVADLYSVHVPKGVLPGENIRGKKKRFTYFCHFEPIRVGQLWGSLHFKWGVLHLENIIIATGWEQEKNREYRKLPFFVILILLIKAVGTDPHKVSKVEKS